MCGILIISLDLTLHFHFYSYKIHSVMFCAFNHLLFQLDVKISIPPSSYTILMHIDDIYFIARGTEKGVYEMNANIYLHWITSNIIISTNECVCVCRCRCSCIYKSKPSIMWFGWHIIVVVVVVVARDKLIAWTAKLIIIIIIIWRNTTNRSSLIQCV